MNNILVPYFTADENSTLKTARFILISLQTNYTKEMHLLYTISKYCQNSSAETVLG
jgi:3-methyladenine DNA glycosylase AlkD